MKKVLHNLLLGTHLIFYKKVFLNLSDTELTSGQPKILDFLKDNDGCMQKDIAVACEIETSTVTSLLYRMEKAGLVERKALNDNRRSLYVFLTDKGSEAVEKVSNTFDKLEDVAFEGFSDCEKEEFIEKFYKIYSNLEREDRPK